VGQSDNHTEYRIVGTVTRPHGILGVLKVRPETDDPRRFDDLKMLYLGRSEDALTPYRVESVAYQPYRAGTAVLIQFEGVSGREGTEKLLGLDVWAPLDELPPLVNGEVFLSDLVGLAVFSESGKNLGEVVDVLEYPAAPTLSVLRPDGSKSLVPFVQELVPEVDLEAGRLTVVAMEGLLEGDPVSERE
jgi:16S rRNA processing protein RimM